MIRESTITLAYIDELLSDPTVDLIEVWDRVLYIRKKKGCGRNTFASKRGLEYELNVYYTPKEFKRISLDYHPDTKRRKSKNQKQLCQDILLSRKPLEAYERERRIAAAIKFVRAHPQFTTVASFVQNDNGTRSVNPAFDTILEAADRAGHVVRVAYDEHEGVDLWDLKESSISFVTEVVREWQAARAEYVAEDRRRRPEYYKRRDEDMADLPF